MLDFGKKPGFRYPLEVILIEQRLLKSRKLIFQEYQDTLYPVLKYAKVKPFFHRVFFWFFDWFFD